MKYKKIIWIVSVTLFIACQNNAPDNQDIPVVGKLKVGFDIDDTILFSKENFEKAPHYSDDADHLDFGWVNQHDSLYSVVIQPIKDLIGFLYHQGHDIYFITARESEYGASVGRFLSRELGFPVVLGKNLFFSPKRTDPQTGRRFTTKHEIIKELGLHLYYGDSDSDIIAATVAGVRAVRIIRDPRSIAVYSKNYFGDLLSAPAPGAHITEAQYQDFLRSGVGPYGETIYPLY